MIDKTETGKKIAVFRKRKGLSQSALAEKLGITTQAVSKWECGQSLPDAELLAELSWLFGVSINSLLEGGGDAPSFAVRRKNSLPQKAECFLNNNDQKPLISSLAPYFTETEISEIAKQCAAGELKVDCRLTVHSKDREKSSEVDLPSLSADALSELAPFLSQAANVAIDDIPGEIRRVCEYFICPKCKKPLSISKSEETVMFTCENGHTAKFVDGVICFDTEEMEGEEWSQVFRNFDDYLQHRKEPVNPNYLRGKFSGDVVWEKLLGRKPKIILDIASGSGNGIGCFIDKIDWPCTVILTDLSYRILKWDKRYLETFRANPFVEFVYIACDCARLPIETASVDAVLSNCGFESMDDGFLDGLAESCRILKNSGAAIYNISVAEDKSSANTKKWLALTRSLGWFSDREMEEQFFELGDWLKHCENCGYAKTVCEKLYDELPAPNTNVFPFPNEIMQWMCSYVCVSTK